MAPNPSLRFILSNFGYIIDFKKVVIANCKHFCVCIVIILALLSVASCTDPEYKHLPQKDIDSDELLKHIVPEKLVQYWQLEDVPGYKDGEAYQLLFSKGNIGRNKIPDYSKDTINMNGFFRGCMPSFCVYRIRHLLNNKWQTVDSEEHLKEFVGQIDNEYEAFIIAKLNNFEVDSLNEGNGFIKTEDGYILKVMKYRSCPKSKESFTIFITKNGELKNIKSQGYYLKTKDCVIS